jgi:hypothetical protein
MASLRLSRTAKQERAHVPHRTLCVCGDALEHGEYGAETAAGAALAGICTYEGGGRETICLLLACCPWMREALVRKRVIGGGAESGRGLYTRIALCDALFRPVCEPLKQIMLPLHVWFKNSGSRESAKRTHTRPISPTCAHPAHPPEVGAPPVAAGGQGSRGGDTMWVGTASMPRTRL